MVHKPGHNSPVGSFSVNLPFQSSRFTDLGPTEEYRRATGQMTSDQNQNILTQQMNAPQQKISKQVKPTQSDISSLIGTTGNQQISDLSLDLSSTLETNKTKDDSFFGKLTGIAQNFSDNMSSPGFYEALVMHQTAKNGGDFTDVLLSGIKVRQQTQDRLFKAAYNNANLERIQTGTDLNKKRLEQLDNPKTTSDKIVTGDDGLKYFLKADGSYERVFPGQEKPTTEKTATDEGPFPKDFNLSNVTKSVKNYIKGEYFPRVDLSENIELNSQLNTMSDRIANEVAPLIKDMGINKAIASVVNKYETGGAFKEGSPASGQGFFDGPAVDAVPGSIDLSAGSQSDPLEQLIQANMKANPEMSRDQVVAEIMKLINANKNM
tara:strand:- start:3146 stop:4279 length:1134 start_codon:yes stop_codon:yes gene_type:complete